MTLFEDLNPKSLRVTVELHPVGDMGGEWERMELEQTVYFAVKGQREQFTVVDLPVGYVRGLFKAFVNDRSVDPNIFVLMLIKQARQTTLKDIERRSR